MYSLKVEDKEMDRKPYTSFVKKGRDQPPPTYPSSSLIEHAIFVGNDETHGPLIVAVTAVKSKVPPSSPLLFCQHSHSQVRPTPTSPHSFSFERENQIKSSDAQLLIEPRHQRITRSPTYALTQQEMLAAMKPLLPLSFQNVKISRVKVCIQAC